jgi:hypothetical protein
MATMDLNTMRKQKTKAINTGYDVQGSYRFVYPPQPNSSSNCVSNLDYDTLPEKFPMRKTILGPTSLKHLYRGPNYYPPQSMKVPDNSLYGYDNSSFDSFGKRRTYGSKLYPFHHRSPREVREYAPTMMKLPAIENWTQYHTVSDGAWGR